MTPDFWWPGPEAAAAIAVRLAAAALLGAVVAAVYRYARREPASSFTATLVLLTVLIAMVTQVIGDNIARAFSLVGALSIVRFRTVVRDTQDTAYVIFAVAVGMAVGASSLWVAVAGLLIVGVVAAAMRGGAVQATGVVMTHRLDVRVAVGQDPERLIAAVLDEYLAAKQAIGASTAKQGAAIEVSYRVALRDGRTVAELVAALNHLDGVQGVDAVRLGDGPEGSKAYL